MSPISSMSNRRQKQMAKPSPLTWLPLLTRALDVEIGIGFKVAGVSREFFRNELYEARKQDGDPRLQGLIIFMPGAPLDDEIWICKKEVELAD